MTIGKINISKALKDAESILHQDHSASPQIRAMMEILIVVIRLLVGSQNDALCDIVGLSTARFIKLCEFY